MTLQHRERLEVDRKIPDDKETSAETAVDEDGQRWERLEVWNFVNVDLAKQARGGGRTETLGRVRNYNWRWPSRNT